MSTPLREEGRTLTIVDVARALGVSKSTVSAAFTGNGNIAARRRDAVRRAALELGYRPNPHAQRLVRGERDNTVALVTSYLALDVVTLKLQLLQKTFTAWGYSAPIHALGEVVISEAVEPAVVMRSLRRLRPLAIACDARGLNAAALEELRDFRAEGGHIVCYDVPVELECDKVIFDREHNSYTAMRHLLELGHREVGFFLPLDDESRLAGVRRALQEFGAPLREAWFHAPRVGRFEEAGGHLAEYVLAQRPRPTAMCVVNDNVAVGFVAQLQRRGVRVPQEMSVVSHNDTLVAAWGASVPLTSVSQPVESIAQQTAELLRDRLQGTYDGPPRTVTVRGELAVRESAAPYREKIQSKEPS